MNLYEINGAVLQLTEMLSEGAVDEQTYNDTLESLGAEIAVEDVVKAIRNKQSLADACRAEADKLSDKKNRAETAVNGLKKLLLTYLTATKQQRVCAGLFCVSKSVSKSAEITDEARIPQEYLVPQPPKIDKKSLLADLKSGAEISGAALRESEFVTIK